MGAIVSDFPALPTHNDADWIATYQMVFDQLTAMGLALPPTPADLTARADLLALLQLHAGNKIKAEVTNDPAGAGYAGKTTVDITTLIQTFRGPDIDGISPPRLSTIWTGLPFTPNFIVEADTIGALA